MKRSTRSLRKRYGRSTHGSLRWSLLPGGGVHAITARGAIYTVLHDKHKRKWVLGGTDQEFLGSAIRRRDVQKLAQQIENGRS
jgi:hypothetical protein